MRAWVVGVGCWVVVAACQRVEPPRAPEPVALPAGPARIATTEVTPPTPPPGEAELQAALARDVRDAGAYEALARLYYERSLSQKSHGILARKVIDQGLAVLAREGRTSADLLATRGLLLLNDGRIDRALEDFAAAVAIDPGLVRAQAALGDAALRLRDFTRAQAAFRAIVEAPGGLQDHEAWLRLGAAEQGLQNFDAAERAYRRAARVAPTDPRPHYALARLATHRAVVTNTDRDENATHASFNRAYNLAGDDPRFAELKAQAAEGMAGRRFFACHYPVGTFYGTEEEYRAWLLLPRENPREEREREAAERKRLLGLEVEAAAAEGAAPATR